LLLSPCGCARRGIVSHDLRATPLISLRPSRCSVGVERVQMQRWLISHVALSVSR
jgi:hypothetical protein